MTAKRVLFVLVIGFVALPAIAGEDWTPRPDWQEFFTSQGVTGTIVVVDERSATHWVCDEARAATRFLPASTFKIPHALFALDAGVVQDEFQIFPWDGVQRPIDAWNRDQFKAPAAAAWMVKKPAQIPRSATTMTNIDLTKVVRRARLKTTDPPTMALPLPIRLLNFPARGPMTIPIR